MKKNSHLKYLYKSYLFLRRNVPHIEDYGRGEEEAEKGKKNSSNWTIGIRLDMIQYKKNPSLHLDRNLLRYSVHFSNRLVTFAFLW